ncbi:hypothetical protein L873DRAFT_1802725 [Choiromyces venosus 120613-1]|uniref:Uncharacterized protein n=1 Tax=Choiromyces venosus 120613-1 TaxID=1336337 RepID=A0A3N4JUM2_9PEZI|nr:hypothetical protein L873DRAFT_1802725 [Choiromyces venosus 120613-1]
MSDLLDISTHHNIHSRNRLTQYFLPSSIPIPLYQELGVFPGGLWQRLSFHRVPYYTVLVAVVAFVISALGGIEGRYYWLVRSLFVFCG